MFFVGLGDFEVPKDVLVGGGRSRKIVGPGKFPDRIGQGGFETAGLFSAFVKPGGYPMDLENRPSPEFDLKAEHPGGRARVLKKTDFL